VITDTVGFIRHLPRELFAAFRATFEEAADADLILHVVDASDPGKDEHIATTLQVLEELDLDRIPRILVFNKADRISPEVQRALARKEPGSVVVTATDRESMRPLLKRLAVELKERWEKSAKMPDVPMEECVAVEELEHPDVIDEAATLDDLLRRAGRRTKKARPDAPC
jgi:GTP-binding protein HflX